MATNTLQSNKFNNTPNINNLQLGIVTNNSANQLASNSANYQIPIITFKSIYKSNQIDNCLNTFFEEYSKKQVFSGSVATKDDQFYKIYILNNGKKVEIGFIRVRNFQAAVLSLNKPFFVLSNILIDPAFRGRKLYKHILERSKIDFSVKGVVLHPRVASQHKDFFKKMLLNQSYSVSSGTKGMIEKLHVFNSDAKYLDSIIGQGSIKVQDILVLTKM